MIRLSSLQVKALNFHVSKDKTRHHLSGWFFDLGDAADDKHVIVATDGHKLIELPVKIEEDFNKIKALLDKKIVIPPTLKPTRKNTGLWIRNNAEINKLLFDNLESQQMLLFIDLEFPDYKRVIPREEVMADRVALRIDASLFFDTHVAVSLPAMNWYEPLTVNYIARGYEDLKDATMLVMPIRKRGNETGPEDTAYCSADEVKELKQKIKELEKELEEYRPNAEQKQQSMEGVL
jgi:hypothetical protein